MQDHRPGEDDQHDHHHHDGDGHSHGPGGHDGTHDGGDHGGQHHGAGGHHHGWHPEVASVLRLSLLLTLCYIGLTIYFGLRAHSLALLSEAGHNASDFLALLLSWVAVYFQNRPPNEHKTFGYHRAGVLAAFLNAITLIIVAGGILWEAVQRLQHPRPVVANIMMAVATIGVVMNATIAWLLTRSGRDVNIRSAVVHMVGDTLSTAAVIVGGAAILFTGQTWIDPVLSIAIGLLILWSSWAIVRETLNILLEGTPRGIPLPAVRQAIAMVDGVLDVHDLHVWSLGTQSHALASHVTIAEMPTSECAAILEQINCRMRESFHINHTTIQFETTGCETTHGCSSPPDLEEVSAHGHHHHHGHGHAH